MTEEDLIRLALELESCRREVFARGKVNETDILYLRPGMRDEIVTALRQAAQSLREGARRKE